MLDQHDLEQHHRVNAGPAVVLAIQILHKFVDFLEVDGVVDFPQPDSPTSPSVSFRRRSNETRFTAFTSPVFFGITPRLRIGKNLHKSRTASNGGASESALKSSVL